MRSPPSSFIRSQPRVFCDETPLPRLDPGAQTHQALPTLGAGGRRSTLEWSRAAGGGLYFCGKPQRSRGRGARRKFVDVVKLTGSSEALSILARIAEVYRIEAKLRGESADTRLTVRRRETAAILKELKVQLTEVSEEVSSKSALGKAVSYTLSHWSGWQPFWRMAGSKRTPMWSKRSMKSVALTRKNSLFVCNERGGKSFAVLASLVTAKLNSVDPEAWLADVLKRIISGKVTANRMETLFPWALKAEREGIADQERRAA